MLSFILSSILALVLGATSSLAATAAAPVLGVDGLDIRAEQDRPQICVRFSAGFERDAHIHYENFIAIEPHSDFGVTIEDRHLCLENLTHGHIYRVHLKRGLPARGDLRLATDKILDAWIPDRQQRIVFQPG